MNKTKTLFRINIFLINFVGFVLSFINFPIILVHRKKLINNKHLKNYKKNRICYICGLGPSLKDVDLTILNGDTIVVNQFYEFDKTRKLIPTYYCMIDSLYGKSEKGKLIEAVKVYPDVPFLINSRFISIIENVFPERKNIFYSFAWKGFIESMPKVDQTKNTSITFNVVCSAIALALYLEYEEIILLGCDFNSFALSKNLHCYDEEVYDNKTGLSLELFSYSLVAEAHYRLNNYAKKNGIKIINATPGSLIDAYPFDINYLSRNYM